LCREGYTSVELPGVQVRFGNSPSLFNRSHQLIPKLVSGDAIQVASGTGQTAFARFVAALQKFVRNGVERKLAVEHSHKSGRNRALLVLDAISCSEIVRINRSYSGG